MNELLLAQSVIAIVTPLAIEAAKSMGETLQTKAEEGLLAWVKGKFKKAGKEETLDKLVAAPERETTQRLVEAELATILEDDPSAMTELTALMEAMPKGYQTQTATSYGNNSPITQIQGNNNKIG